MGTAICRLRLAIALGHALPEGVIDIAFDDGARVRATRDSSEAMTPCSLRALVVMGAWPLGPGAADRVTDVTVTGPDVRDMGGGVYARDGREAQRWLATVLAPSSVQELLASCPLEFASAIDASLRPDVDLGVTVVVLSGPGPDRVDPADLDAAVRWLSSVVYTEELVRDLQDAR